METRRMKRREWQLWQCNYFQQEKEIKHTEGAAICKKKKKMYKRLDPSRSVPPRWYYKSRLTLSFLLDRDFKKFAWLPAKVIKLLKLIWANQAVSGRQWSQVDLRTAFTEPEVEQFCSFSPHQSKGTWEETWERGWWWGWVGRGSGRGEIVPVVTIKENEGNRVRQGSDQVRLAT